MNVDELPVQDIIPYGKNPRKNEEAVDVVAKSIEQFGFQQPLVLDKDCTIVVGHTRFKAALKLGFKTIPCIIADNLSDEQINAYRIMDNKSSEYAFWHEGLLLQEMTKLLEQDYDLEFTGFSDVELKELGLNVDLGFVDEGFAHEDDVPDVPDEPVTKPGDIWLLGNHRLVCGDSTSVKTLESLMQGDTADMMFTDPPYGMSYGGGRAKGNDVKFKNRSGGIKAHGPIINDDLRSDELVQLLSNALKCAVSVCKSGASKYICFPWRTYAQFEKALVTNLLKPSACIVWDKKSIGLGQANYRPQHEFIFYVKGDDWHGDRAQSDVWYMSRGATGNYVHPTQKPVELIEKALINSSKRQDLVIDVFGGSGSTIIACERTDRFCRMVELDPKYCDVIVKRWENFTNQTAKLQILTENGERIRKING